MSRIQIALITRYDAAFYDLEATTVRCDQAQI